MCAVQSLIDSPNQDIPQRLERLDDTDLVSRTVLVYQLCKVVFESGHTFGENNALILHEATNDFLLRLGNWSERQYQEVVDWRRTYYELFFRTFTVLLRLNGRLEQSCATAAQNVAIVRWLFLRHPHPEQYLEFLASSLYAYSASLREAGRFVEACDPSAEDVSLKRLIYASDPKMHCYELADSLYQYGRCLYEAGQFDTACEISAEAVSLVRSLYAGGQEMYHQHLSAFLTQYGITLRSAQRSDEACIAGAEDVSIMRILFARDANHALNLADSLYHYGVSLRAAGRHNEACDISAEVVSLMRQLAAADLNEHRERLEETLDGYCEALRLLGRGEQALAVNAEKEAMEARFAQM